MRKYKRTSQREGLNRRRRSEGEKERRSDGKKERRRRNTYKQ